MQNFKDNFTEGENACIFTSPVELEDRKDLLYSAIRKGNINVIRNLIANTKDFAHFVNDVCARDVLESAVLTKHIDIVQLLLENGAKVDNRREEYPFSALLAAVHIGDEKIVNMLLERNADLNAEDRYGQNPLHIAAKLGDLSITKLLLDHGADINSLSNWDDERQETPLYLAVEKNRLETVELLLRKGADLNAGGLKDEKPIFVATRLGYEKMVQLLLEYGAEVNGIYKCIRIMNIEYCTLLHVAAKYKQAAVAELLINSGADVNAVDANQNTPIFYAVQDNAVIVTKILLNNGATVKNSLLSTAVMEGHREIVEILLQHSIDIHDRDDKNRTALHHVGIMDGERWKVLMDEAAKEQYKSDKTEIAKLLLSRGASVNLKDRYGVTALYSAARNNKPELVQILLEYKANVNIEEHSGLTPLHAAIYAENKDIVKMLLNQGAHVNVMNDNGFSPLYIASEMGSKTLVELLLKHGATIDHNMFEKKSDFRPISRLKNPLNIAVEKGHYEIVELLLKFGLQIDFGDPTPLQTAAYYGKVDIWHLLIEYGADINANIQGGSYRGYGSPLHAIKTVLHSFRYCGEDRRQGCKEIANILERRIVKMTAASMHVDEAHIEEIDFPDNYNDLKNDCDREIEVLKNEKIGDSNVSFYDVLINDIKQVTMYARNESIVEALESTQLEEKCPLYSQLISENFKRGQRRNSIMSLSSKLIITSVGIELPTIVTDAILEYLSDAELILFINALDANAFQRLTKLSTV